eukprot:CAMPEP_0117439896 /NCGR_PEP_ID=MMETSP0759-20121206/2797_1 /TAXON_ID=63605 /ORGANISM="Percolomonas cosmopolitus, Strain WS" /LENGTH=458 /DNA_ID=CAMNT_0005231617 /DNA_START=4 /DNA_END=1381 /DNA_ORIENTATION=-
MTSTNTDESFPTKTSSNTDESKTTNSAVPSNISQSLLQKNNDSATMTDTRNIASENMEKKESNTENIAFGNESRELEQQANEANGAAPPVDKKADKMALMLQNQLKKRKFQMMTNEVFEDENSSEVSRQSFSHRGGGRGRGSRRGGRMSSTFQSGAGPPHKKQKRSQKPKHQFILPELSEDVMQKYSDRRRKNFPTREKMRHETEERWLRAERGEVIWEDYSRNQWQLNKEEDHSNTASSLHNPHNLKIEEDRINSLLDSIVQSDQEREINVVLQAFRFFVHHRFFLSDHELNSDIEKQLNDLSDRTQREMISVKEMLKKKYPREEDKANAISDDDDGAMEVDENGARTTPNDTHSDDDEDIEENAINLSDSELERLAAKEGDTTGGAEINTHADAEEVVGATIIAEGVVETPEVVEDTVITEEEEAIREVVASVGVVHTEDTESEVRTKDNTNIETV